MQIFDGDNKTINCAREVYDWKDVDFDMLNYKLSLLNLDDIVVKYEDNIDIMWDKWIKAILTVVDKNVKKFKIKKKLFSMG